MEVDTAETAAAIPAKAGIQCPGCPARSANGPWKQGAKPLDPRIRGDDGIEDVVARVSEAHPGVSRSRVRFAYPGYESTRIVTRGAAGLRVRAAHADHDCNAQILPTRSSDGLRVFSPSFHLAGHTSPGCAAT